MNKANSNSIGRPYNIFIINYLAMQLLIANGLVISETTPMT